MSNAENVTISKLEVLNINKSLMSITGTTNSKFAYSVYKLLNYIGVEVEALSKAIPKNNSEYVKEISKELIKIGMVLENDVFIIPNNIIDGRKEIEELALEIQKKLKEKYSEELLEYDKQIKEYNGILTEKIDIPYEYLIEQQVLPETIDITVMKVIGKIIKD